VFCLFRRLPSPYSLTSLGNCIVAEISAPAFANGPRNVPTKGIGFEDMHEQYKDVRGNCRIRSVVRFTGNRPDDHWQRAGRGKDDYDIIDTRR
jgi:hypothetical protein